MPGAANPRGVDSWSGRIMEFTGGARPREMVGDFDVNPNENADGLSHHNREGTSTEEFQEQIDPKKRREKAMKDMDGGIPHISIKPEVIGEMLNETPMLEDESRLLETGLGVDMGHMSNGIGISTGANLGPVRREGPGLIFGRSNDAFEDAWSLVKTGMFGDEDEDKDEELERIRERYANIAAQEEQRIYAEQFDDTTKDNKISQNQAWTNININRMPGRQADRITGAVEGSSSPGDSEAEMMEDMKRQHHAKNWDLENTTLFSPVPKHSAVPDIGYEPDDPRYSDDPDSLHNLLDRRIGSWHIDPEKDKFWIEEKKSSDPVFISDISKGKRRKKRGRKYEEDEESEEEEKKSKKKRQRKRKRALKRGKNRRRGSRDIKGLTARRAGAVEQNVGRDPKGQAFAPRRMMGGNPRAKSVPLRIRDPIAYQRKLANERMARQQGALPRDMTAHHDTRGIKGKVQTIGMEGKGTKMPSQPQGSKGTSLSGFKKPKSAEREGSLIHDPLGSDPLKMAIAKNLGLGLSGKGLKGLNRSELLDLRRNVKKLVEMLGKVTKSTEHDYKTKRGSTASEEKSTDPGAKSLEREEDKAAYRFVDLSSGVNGHLVGKK